MNKVCESVGKHVDLIFGWRYAEWVVGDDETECERGRWKIVFIGMFVR